MRTVESLFRPNVIIVESEHTWFRSLTRIRGKERRELADERAAKRALRI
jgi:hypothetical protein